MEDDSREIGKARLKEKNNQRDTHQHRGRNIDQCFHVPAHVQTPDHAVQQPGNQNHFKHQRQAG
jgi:hypothetical protein